VDPATVDQLAKAPQGDVFFAGRHEDVDLVGELSVCLVLIRLERLFQPAAAHLLHGPGDPCRGRDVCPVAEPGVDHDLDGLAARRPGGLREPYVVAGIFTQRPPAQLDGGEALLTQLDDRLLDLAFGVRHQPRGVSAHSGAAGGADQLTDGLAQRLALDVPERDVDAADGVYGDAPAAGVEDAAVHLAPQLLHTGWILADEGLSQAHRDRVGAGCLDHCVHHLGSRGHLADPDDPIVGAHSNDEVVLAAVGNALVELGLAEDDRLNVRDLQAPTIVTENFVL